MQRFREWREKLRSGSSSHLNVGNPPESTPIPNPTAPAGGAVPPSPATIPGPAESLPSAFASPLSSAASFPSSSIHPSLLAKSRFSLTAADADGASSTLSASTSLIQPNAASAIGNGSGSGSGHVGAAASTTALAAATVASASLQLSPIVPHNYSAGAPPIPPRHHHIQAPQHLVQPHASHFNSSLVSVSTVLGSSSSLSATDGHRSARHLLLRAMLESSALFSSFLAFLPPLSQQELLFVCEVNQLLVSAPALDGASLVIAAVRIANIFLRPQQPDLSANPANSTSPSSSASTSTASSADIVSALPSIQPVTRKQLLSAIPRFLEASPSPALSPALSFSPDRSSVSPSVPSSLSSTVSAKKSPEKDGKTVDYSRILSLLELARDQVEESLTRKNLQAFVDFYSQEHPRDLPEAFTVYLEAMALASTTPSGTALSPASPHPALPPSASHLASPSRPLTASQSLSQPHLRPLSTSSSTSTSLLLASLPFDSVLFSDLIFRAFFLFLAEERRHRILACWKELAEALLLYEEWIQGPAVPVQAELSTSASAGPAKIHGPNFLQPQRLKAALNEHAENESMKPNDGMQEPEKDKEEMVVVTVTPLLSLALPSSSDVVAVGVALLVPPPAIGLAEDGSDMPVRSRATSFSTSHPLPPTLFSPDLSLTQHLYPLLTAFESINMKFFPDDESGDSADESSSSSAPPSPIGERSPSSSAASFAAFPRSSLPPEEFDERIRIYRRLLPLLQRLRPTALKIEKILKRQCWAPFCKSAAFKQLAEVLPPTFVSSFHAAWASNTSGTLSPSRKRTMSVSKSSPSPSPAVAPMNTSSTVSAELDMEELALVAAVSSSRASMDGEEIDRERRRKLVRRKREMDMEKRQTSATARHVGGGVSNGRSTASVVAALKASKSLRQMLIVPCRKNRDRTATTAQSNGAHAGANGGSERRGGEVRARRGSAVDEEMNEDSQRILDYVAVFRATPKFIPPSSAPSKPACAPLPPSAQHRSSVKLHYRFPSADLPGCPLPPLLSALCFPFNDDEQGLCQCSEKDTHDSRRIGRSADGEDDETIDAPKKKGPKSDFWGFPIPQPLGATTPDSTPPSALPSPSANASLTSPPDEVFGISSLPCPSASSFASSSPFTPSAARIFNFVLTSESGAHTYGACLHLESVEVEAISTVELDYRRMAVLKKKLDQEERRKQEMEVLRLMLERKNEEIDEVNRRKEEDRRRKEAAAAGGITAGAAAASPPPLALSASSTLLPSAAIKDRDRDREVSKKDKENAELALINSRDRAQQLLLNSKNGAANVKQRKKSAPKDMASRFRALFNSDKEKEKEKAKITKPPAGQLQQPQSPLLPPPAVENQAVHGNGSNGSPAATSDSSQSAGTGEDRSMSAPDVNPQPPPHPPSPPISPPPPAGFTPTSPLLPDDSAPTISWHADAPSPTNAQSSVGAVAGVAEEGNTPTFTAFPAAPTNLADEFRLLSPGSARLQVHLSTEASPRAMHADSSSSSSSNPSSFSSSASSSSLSSSAAVVSTSSPSSPSEVYRPSSTLPSGPLFSSSAIMNEALLAFYAAAGELNEADFPSPHTLLHAHSHPQVHEPSHLRVSSKAVLQPTRHRMDSGGGAEDAKAAAAAAATVGAVAETEIPVNSDLPTLRKVRVCYAICVLTRLPFVSMLRDALTRLAEEWLTVQTEAGSDSPKFSASVTAIPNARIRHLLRSSAFSNLLRLCRPLRRGINVFNSASLAVANSPAAAISALGVSAGTRGPLSPLRLPPLDVNFEALFRSLRARRVVIVLESLLMEKKVLLLSRSLSLLTVVCESLLALLYPFHWRYLYVPLLPFSLFRYLQIPTPFLIGIHSCYKWHALDSVDRDVVIVDLDHDEVLCPVATEGQRLPLPLRDYLTQRLSALFYQDLVFMDFQNADTDRREKAVWPSPSARSLLVRLEFVKLWAHFLSFYRSFVYFLPDAEQPVILFDAPSFVAHKPALYQPFLASLLATSFFFSFLFERTEEAPYAVPTYPAQSSAVLPQHHLQTAHGGPPVLSLLLSSGLHNGLRRPADDAFDRYERAASKQPPYELTWNEHMRAKAWRSAAKQFQEERANDHNPEQRVANGVTQQNLCDCCSAAKALKVHRFDSAEVAAILSECGGWRDPAMNRLEALRESCSQCAGRTFQQLANLSDDLFAAEHL